MRDHKNFQHIILMLLFFLIPVFILIILADSGLKLSPTLFFLFFAISCIAMLLFMGKNHSKEGSEPEENYNETNQDNVEQSTPPHGEEGSKERIPIPENLDDIFKTNYFERTDDTLIFTGNLLIDSETAYQKLKESSDKLDVSTLLQEDDAGSILIIVSKKSVHREETDQKTSVRNEINFNKSISNPTINLVLFILTFITTTYAGALHQGVNLFKEPDKFNIGLPYAMALMLILGAHELGHYFAARKHKINVTLPYFIPVPFALGTFGAFIRMKSPSENRKALFDVGVAGPIAGLVFAIPALIIGLQNSTIIPITNENAMSGGADVGSSILLALLAKITLSKDLITGHTLQFSPLAFAGWLGLFVTALNLLPIGQLDGGHIAHALFGRKNANTIGMVALFSLFLLGLFVWSGLLTWAIIVFFLAGIKSAPPLNDVTQLDNRRVAIGLIAFIILFMILIPVPHSFYESLGIYCPYI